VTKLGSPMPLGVILAASVLGCTVGEGQGAVTSDRLYIQDCWNGAFDLRPDFFATTPFSGETQLIRVQRGDNLQEMSDGLMVLVNDTPRVRAQLNTTLKVGLPVGVSPPGESVEYDPDPPLVNLSLYLHDSCHTQSATLHSVEGTITFSRLFSGNVNEKDGSERFTKASFSASFADPRHLVPGQPLDSSVVSLVDGQFEFFFQRGQPAQPFP
jgi:hypothetical protein